MTINFLLKDEDAEELFATQEEKPQIAGIVDERPAQVPCSLPWFEIFKFLNVWTA